MDEALASWISFLQVISWPLRRLSFVDHTLAPLQKVLGNIIEVTLKHDQSKPGQTTANRGGQHVVGFLRPPTVML